MQSNKFSDPRVGDLVEPVTSFSSMNSIARVIGYLKESKEYDAIIEDDYDTSIVSVRDLLNVENITTEKLSRIMKQVPRVAEQDKMIDAAKLIFEYRIRSLPVYRENKLIGKISCSSIAKTLVGSNHKGDSIARIATPEPICLNSSDSVSKARRIMIDRKIDQLPILKVKRLDGVITSDSIVFRILPETDRDVKGNRRIGRMDEKVGALSQTQTITNDVTDSLGMTLENMLNAGTNYSVILNDDEVQGIVTYRDFMKLLPLKQSQEEIPITIVGLPDDPMQSEMAKQKFQSSMKLLSRAMPDLSEARAIIKSGETKAPKKRYQVQVFVSSVSAHYNYEVSEYDLAKAFEEVEVWIKKLALQNGKRPKHRESARKSRP